MNSYFEQVDDNLRRIKLVANLLAEIHTQIVDPLYPEARADLLLATEDLAETSLEILLDIRQLAWEDNKTPPSDYS